VVCPFHRKTDFILNREINNIGDKMSANVKDDPNKVFLAVRRGEDPVKARPFEIVRI
jgi:hypothetical protein